MARVHDTITIRSELRPCYVNGEPCLFHKWITDYQPRSTHMIDEDGEDNWEVAIYEVTMGLVEHENGTVSMESVQLIKFADADRRFDELFGEEG